MKELYFIAVVLPLDIREEVYNFKKIMAEKYYVRHLSKSPAYFTVHISFKCENMREGELYRALTDITMGMRSLS